MMANNGWSSVASPVMTGRTVIYSAEKEVTRDNILDIFMSAQQIHQTNATQIEYLYNYYKGKPLEPSLRVYSLPTIWKP